MVSHPLLSLTPINLSRYAIACIAFIWIIYSLLVTGLSTARTKSSAVSGFYTMIAGYTLLVWVAYPIIWAVAAGTRHLSVDGEIIAYAVLDVLAKGVFGAWLLFTHKRIPDTDVTVGGFWAHGLNSEGRIRVGEEDEGA
jgi:bacteriorhodopsin